MPGQGMSGGSPARSLGDVARAAVGCQALAWPKGENRPNRGPFNFHSRLKSTNDTTAMRPLKALYPPFFFAPGGPCGQWRPARGGFQCALLVLRAVGVNRGASARNRVRPMIR